MSATLAIALNVIADLMILGLLAFVMSQARHLTPHASAPGDGARRQTRPPESQRRARHVPAASAVVAPARS